MLRIPVVGKELLSQRTDDYRIIVDGGIKRRYLPRVATLAENQPSARRQYTPVFEYCDGFAALPNEYEALSIFHDTCSR